MPGRRLPAPPPARREGPPILGPRAPLAARLAEDGYLYAGRGASVAIYDISGDDPTQIGEFILPGLLPEVLVDGDTMYAVTTNQWCISVDITDRTHPQELDRVPFADQPVEAMFAEPGPERRNDLLSTAAGGKRVAGGLRRDRPTRGDPGERPHRGG